MKKSNKYIGICVSLGGIFLAVVSVKSQIEKYLLFPDWLEVLLLTFGIILLVFASILFGLKYFIRLLDDDVEFICRHLDLEEIDWTLKYTSSVAPELVPPRGKVFYWYDINPKTYFIVTKKSIRITKKEKIIGFFVISPITKVAEKLLLNNNLVGHMLKKSHILKPEKKASAYYIGNIISKGRRNKYETLLAVSSFIQSKLSQTDKEIVFFTNPATEDGLRLANRRGFVPVGSSGKLGETIYVRKMNV